MYCRITEINGCEMPKEKCCVYTLLLIFKNILRIIIIFACEGYIAIYLTSGSQSFSKMFSLDLQVTPLALTPYYDYNAIHCMRHQFFCKDFTAPLIRYCSSQGVMAHCLGVTAFDYEKP